MTRRKGNLRGEGTEQTVTTMTEWATYLATITRGASAPKIARHTKLNHSTVWRWLHGDSKPGAQAAIRVALAYGANPGDALIAAGITTADQLNRERLDLAGASLAEVPTEVLLAEVGRRTNGQGNEPEQDREKKVPA